MTSYLLIFFYIMISLLLVETSQMFVVDKSTSTHHILQLILVGFCVGKKLIVQSLEEVRKR
jgi:hypothetical protein